MSCEQEVELTAYVDGELSPAEVAAVQTHLHRCASCRSTEALLRRTVETLAALPAFEPSRDLRRRVLTGVDGAPAAALAARVRALLRPLVLVPSAAGLIAAAAVAVLLVGPGRRALPPGFEDPAALGVAMNFEVVDNYEVLGLDGPDDLEVVTHLQELEGRP
jgi:anti-sigma factor RsiW